MFKATKKKKSLYYFYYMIKIYLEFGYRLDIYNSLST